MRPSKPEVKLVIEPASLADRFFPYFLDSLLLLSPLLALGWFFGFMDQIPTFLVYVLPVLYFTILEGIWGTTPGKKSSSIRVVVKSDSPGVLERADPPGVLRAATRAVVFLGVLPVVTGVVGLLPIGTRSSAVLAILLNYLALFGMARQQNGFAGLHDLISGTRVVRVQTGKAESQTAP